MAKILIIYSTTDGHTLKICQRLQRVIEQEIETIGVTLVSINEAQGVDLSSFDTIVIGASIRYGKHRPQVYAFIKNNREILESKSNAFFSVNIVARKPGKNRPETNPYVIKFLKKTAWSPGELAVFAGRLDYPKYYFWDKQIIRLIMWMTKGPTDSATVAEFTNWAEVDEFARRIRMMQ